MDGQHTFAFYIKCVPPVGLHQWVPPSVLMRHTHSFAFQLYGQAVTGSGGSAAGYRNRGTGHHRSLPLSI